MRNLFFIPLLAVIVIGFNSCGMGGHDTGNYTIFPPSTVVVGYDKEMGGIIMCTWWGNVAAPSLIGSIPGDCLYVSQFTIDYDDQPSKDYFTAINIVKEGIDRYPFEQSNSVDLREYTLPISSLEGNTCLFFDGMFFISTVTKDKTPRFRMVYNSEEETTSWTKNLYVMASPTASSDNDNVTLGAFNLNSFVYTHGNDTTINVEGYKNGMKCKYSIVNIKYYSGVDGDGIPIFKALNSPFYIYISD